MVAAIMFSSLANKKSGAVLIVKPILVFPAPKALENDQIRKNSAILTVKTILVFPAPLALGNDQIRRGSASRCLFLFGHCLA